MNTKGFTNNTYISFNKINKLKTRSTKIVKKAYINHETISHDLVSWIMPITIIGRAMELEYKNIIQGVTLIELAKLLIEKH